MNNIQTINHHKLLPLEVQKVSSECSASLCIINLWLHNTDSVNGVFINGDGQIWYPEESICTCYRKQAVKELLKLENGNAPKWIKRQNSIKKHNEKKGIKQADGYFTYEMLNADRMVKGSTRGINPDYDESIQMERFFNTNTKKQGVNVGKA